MAKFTLTGSNGQQLVAKIKTALGTNPRVELKEFRHFLSEERTVSQDQIKGVTLREGTILITLKKAGRREIGIGEEFHLYNDKKMGKRLSLGSGWTIIQA